MIEPGWPSGIHTGEDVAEVVGAGVGGVGAKAEGDLGLALLQLLENGGDEIADGRVLDMEAFATEVGIEGGRDELDDLDIPGFQQLTHRKSKGVEEGLCSGIDRHLCQGYKGKTGGDVDDGPEGGQVKEQRAEMEGGFDVDLYLLSGALIEILIVQGHPVLNACIVDEYVEVAMIGGYPFVKAFPIGGRGEVTFFCKDGGELAGKIFEDIGASSANDDRVTFFYKAFCQAAAYARCAAGDQDLVFGKVHKSEN
jgi:hypothetical protein